MPLLYTPYSTPTLPLTPQPAPTQHVVDISFLSAFPTEKEVLYPYFTPQTLPLLYPYSTPTLPRPHSYLTPYPNLPPHVHPRPARLHIVTPALVHCTGHTDVV